MECTIAVARREQQRSFVRTFQVLRAGLLYDRSVPSLVIAVVLAQAVALLMLFGVLARTRQHRRDPA
jgi:ABC-type phosphate/phosphonate transport system permease subunit